MTNPSNEQSNPFGAFPTHNNANDMNHTVANKPGVGSRFLAFFIDLILLIVLSVVMVYLLAWNDITSWVEETMEYTNATQTGTVDPATAPQPDLMMANVAVFASVILWLIYRAAMESTTGGSLGRMATGTRVIDANTGGNLSFANGLIRSSWAILVSVAQFVPFIGSLLVLAIHIAVAVTSARDTQGQSFTDKWAKAQVVKK